MPDNQTTDQALPRFALKDVALGALWIVIITGAGTLGSNLLFHFHAPAWEAGVVLVVVIVALSAIAVAAIVLTPFYVIAHLRKQSGAQDDR